MTEYFADRPRTVVVHDDKPTGLLAFLLIILMTALGIVIFLLLNATGVCATDSSGLTQEGFYSNAPPPTC